MTPQEPTAADRWDITREEVAAIDVPLNFSDAHNRMTPSPSMRARIDNGLITDAWLHAQTEPYNRLVSRFLTSFAAISSPSLVEVDRDSIFLCYASSVAMSIIASALRSLSISVSLLEPTFDNIPDLLRQAGVEIIPLDEDRLLAMAFPADTSCIFLTSPNNPTGRGLNESQTRDLFAEANSRGAIVILDRSFGVFDPVYNFDIYALAAGFDNLSLVVIEDTGKILPTLDQKLGVIVAPKSMSPIGVSLRKAIAQHHSSVLLNISPFTLSVVAEFCEEALDGGLSYVRGIIAQNRELLRTRMSAVRVRVPAPSIASKASVELLEIDSLGTSRDVARRLESAGVFVLSADKFFWSRRSQDSGLLRVALARDSSLFEEGVDAMSRQFRLLSSDPE